MPDQEYETIDKYDRRYGEALDAGTKTKPSTVRIVDTLGRAET